MEETLLKLENEMEKALEAKLRSMRFLTVAEKREIFTEMMKCVKNTIKGTKNEEDDKLIDKENEVNDDNNEELLDLEDPEDYENDV